MELNELINSAAPTLVFGTLIQDTDELKDVFDTKKKKLVKKRVKGTKVSRVYVKVGANRKILGGK